MRPPSPHSALWALYLPLTLPSVTSLEPFHPARLLLLPLALESRAGSVSASSRPALSIPLPSLLLHHFLFPSSSPLSLPLAPFPPLLVAGPPLPGHWWLLSALLLASRSLERARWRSARPLKGPGRARTWRVRASGGERSGGPGSAVSLQPGASRSPQAAGCGKARAGRGGGGGASQQGEGTPLWELEAVRLICV